MDVEETQLDLDIQVIKQLKNMPHTAITVNSPFLWVILNEGWIQL